MIVTTKNKVKRSFSKASRQYEQLAWLQKRIGLELLDRLNYKKKNIYVLDVGMGTGWLTQELQRRVYPSPVVGIDFASGMIARARNKNGCFQIVQADARALPFQSNTFDIIVSNLVYQWVEDLDLAFSLIYDILKEDGTFYLSCFGKKTLQELFFSLERCFGHASGLSQLSIRRLADQNRIAECLSRSGFLYPEVHCECIKSHFPDMFSLIRWLKNIGANGMKKDIFLGRDLLLRANDFYNRNFCNRKGIYATFEVIWVEVRK